MATTILTNSTPTPINNIISTFTNFINSHHNTKLHNLQQITSPTTTNIKAIDAVARTTMAAVFEPYTIFLKTPSQSDLQLKRQQNITLSQSTNTQTPVKSDTQGPLSNSSNTTFNSGQTHHYPPTPIIFNKTTGFHQHPFAIDSAQDLTVDLAPNYFNIAASKQFHPSSLLCIDNMTEIKHQLLEPTTKHPPPSVV